MPHSVPRFWRVHCHIGQHPGQWQYWFREQCCAVGWHPKRWGDVVSPEGWEFSGPSTDRGWVAARNALREMAEGDVVIATLPGGRIGRLGTIVRKAVGDHEWNPIVPKSSNLPFGENGRRIEVRWDLSLGPDDPSKVVLLPAAARFNSGELRATVRELPISKLDTVKAAMRDESNWVSLAGAFSMEAALSGYISIHPGRLEAGMIAHPSIEVLEFTFSDRRRADVMLQDRAGRVVIVECKQDAPTIDALKQVDQYRDQLWTERPDLGRARAVLVHGGASRVAPEIAEEAKRREIELVYFDLQVNFFASRG